MKRCMSSRFLLLSSIALLVVNLVVMLLGRPEIAYAQKKLKAPSVEYTFVWGADLNQVADLVNELSPKGWRAKSIATNGYNTQVLLERTR